MVTTDANGCTSSFSELIQMSVTIANFVTTNTTCVGENVTFTNTSFVLGADMGYQWIITDNATGQVVGTEQTNNVSETFIYSYPAAGEYTIELIPNHPCSIPDMQTVTVFEQSVADFIVPTPICAGETVTITNTSTLSLIHI